MFFYAAAKSEPAKGTNLPEGLVNGIPSIGI